MNESYMYIQSAGCGCVRDENGTFIQCSGLGWAFVCVCATCFLFTGTFCCMGIGVWTAKFSHVRKVFRPCGQRKVAMKEQMDDWRHFVYASHVSIILHLICAVCGQHFSHAIWLLLSGTNCTIQYKCKWLDWWGSRIVCYELRTFCCAVVDRKASDLDMRRVLTDHVRIHEWIGNGIGQMLAERWYEPTENVCSTNSSKKYSIENFRRNNFIFSSAWWNSSLYF